MLKFKKVLIKAFDQDNKSIDLFHHGMAQYGYESSMFDEHLTFLKQDHPEIVRFKLILEL